MLLIPVLCSNNNDNNNNSSGQNWIVLDKHYVVTMFRFVVAVQNSSTQDTRKGHQGGFFFSLCVLNKGLKHSDSVDT